LAHLKKGAGALANQLISTSANQIGTLKKGGGGIS
jgi:hypothetical protein